MFGFDDSVSERLKIVNKFIPDKEQVAKLQAELNSEFMKYESKFVSYQRDIIVAGARSESYLARKWLRRVQKRLKLRQKRLRRHQRHRRRCRE